MIGKRFLVEKATPDSWYLYWANEGGPASPIVAVVYDKETLDLLVQAPALMQLNRIARSPVNSALGVDATMRPREYKPSVFGRFQEQMARFLKRKGVQGERN